ncbi:branched-chain amino acid ABC transporter permease [Clostridium bovifaecis]|uniref:Branched-chain amino acid ABC transporter permease n=1 Tax=Clostridium bovifaecis TaxID=2184719 RepID=A0A6I6F7N7_9CLOT|nr:branched-chain amino acid ABC transporter permease [Clostridium bovifaecis]
MSTILILIVYGISLGMLYFLLASGLSLIFGLMNVLNLAHGSLFMWGAYLSFTIYKYTNSFILGLLGGAVIVAILGAIFEKFLIKPLKGKHMYQLLMTFGLIYILDEIVKMVWGTKVMVAPKPDWLNGSIDLGSNVLPYYRLFIIIAGIIVFIGVTLLLKKTKLGMIIRAGIERPHMVRAIGINVDKVFTFTFALGAAMAGLGGAVAAPFLSLYPTIGVEQIFYALIVVVIGGIGNFSGSIAAGLLVGIVQSIIGYFVPELYMLSAILIMIVTLIAKPAGLLSKGAKA